MRNLKKLQALVARQKFRHLGSAVRQMEFVLTQEVGALNLGLFVYNAGLTGPVSKLLECHPPFLLQRECKGRVATSRDLHHSG